MVLARRNFAARRPNAGWPRPSATTRGTIPTDGAVARETGEFAARWHAVLRPRQRSFWSALRAPTLRSRVLRVTRGQGPSTAQLNEPIENCEALVRAARGAHGSERRARQAPHMARTLLST